MPYYSGSKLPPRFGESHRLCSSVGQYHWLDSLSRDISSCVLYLGGTTYCALQLCGLTVQFPSLGRATVYAPLLVRVTCWTPCLGKATGCVQQIGRTFSWALLWSGVIRCAP